ncbi:hypothetical protein D3C86_1229890 [compost metagenome]
MPRLFFQDQRAHHRYIGKRKYKGSQDGKRNRLCHRAEHLSFNADQRQNRQVDNQDDNLAKGRTASYFYRGLVYLIVHLFRRKHLSFPDLQPVDDGFYDNHRPVDDDPEIDRSQAHQVAAYAEKPHHGDCEQQSQRNHGSHDQSGTPVSEQ